MFEADVHFIAHESLVPNRRALCDGLVVLLVFVQPNDVDYVIRQNFTLESKSKRGMPIGWLLRGPTNLPFWMAVIFAHIRSPPAILQLKQNMSLMVSPGSGTSTLPSGDVRTSRVPCGCFPHRILGATWG
jgi:hypothetical protein